MDLEIYKKTDGVILVEYEHGFGEGKSGVEWYEKNDQPNFLNHVSMAMGMGEFDVLAEREKNRSLDIEFRKMRERVKALERALNNSGVDLKSFYEKNVSHEALVQYNIEGHRKAWKGEGLFEDG